MKLTEITEILTALGAVGGFVTEFFAVCQYRRDSRMKKADLFNTMVERLRSEPDIRKWILVFDYGKPWYNEDFHKYYQQQVEVDKTLQTLSYFCYLKQSSLISEKEFSMIKYELWRTLGNRDVQAYLFNVYHFSSRFFERKHRGRKKDTRDFPFNYLLAFGVSKGLIDEEFFDKNSNRYGKNLNY